MDITDRLLQMAPKLKGPGYKNRFIASEVPSTEAHFVSETANLLSVLNDAGKILKELESVASGRVQFESHSDRSQKLSEKLENSIKVAQIKLEETKNIEIPSCCSAAINEVLQKRLFVLTKKFQSSLQARTKQLKKKSAKMVDLEVVSKDQPTFLESDE